MRTIKNLLYHTFIGLNAEVLNSSARELVGKKGRVVDETKNLLVIEDARGREIKIQKAACVFRFHADDGRLDVKGRKIAFRPEERAKKLSF